MALEISSEPFDVTVARISAICGVRTKTCRAARGAERCEEPHTRTRAKTWPLLVAEFTKHRSETCGPSHLGRTTARGRREMSHLAKRRTQKEQEPAPPSAFANTALETRVLGSL